MVRSRLRLALVSEDLALPIDEGLKKFVFSVASHLPNDVEAITISTAPQGPLPDSVRCAPANHLMRGKELSGLLASFKPDRLIYVPRAAGTRNAFIRSAVLKRHSGGCTTMMVSLQVRQYGPLARLLIRRFHPDVTVAQGFATRDQLAGLGIRAAAIPSGVDVDRFLPADVEVKRALRRKYDLDRDEFIVLHVGHLRHQRNLQVLGRIRRELGIRVVMVASTSMEADAGVRESLEEEGVMVIRRYVDDIAELYQLSDCYLFPVHAYYGAIEMPLSVLEAMGCGLRVVSTPFGSLPQWIPPGSGMNYAADDDELVNAVRSAALGKEVPDPSVIRARVKAFSWDAIASRLLAPVDSLVTERGSSPTPVVVEKEGDVTSCAS